ncbi:ComEA family DNA-binding protein [Leucobacter chromiireducens]|uniref:ComEA family DNA-binding protein n=1 Tax=Leucobacter chromiireducens TaxID=283877 RepID=UPI000F63E30B|nr:ComEA family DNA-binding protein [Leucobacter chromiireducens]
MSHRIVDPASELDADPGSDRGTGRDADRADEPWRGAAPRTERPVVWPPERVLTRLRAVSEPVSPLAAELAAEPNGDPVPWRLAQAGDEARPTLRWDPELPLGARLLRALRAPLWAGVAVFLAAVLIAIGIAAVQLSGGEVSAGAGAVSVGDGADSAGDGAAVEGGGEFDADAGAGEETGSGTLWVHVVGEVQRPGLVELRAESRVADGIAAAGGATDAAALAGVNLARRLEDGEQLRVPTADEAAEAEAGGDSVGAGGAGQGSGAPSGAGAAVRLSTADAAALETLPRIGPGLAARILEWRAANGDFSSIEQLAEVPGIGEKTLAGLRDHVVP